MSSTKATLGLDLCPGSPTLLEVLFRASSLPAALCPDFVQCSLLGGGPGCLDAPEAALQDTLAWQHRAVGGLSSLSEPALSAEYGWASHLGLTTVLAPALPGLAALEGCGRALCSLLAGEEGPMLCLRLPLSAEVDDAAQWRAWDGVRSLCGHNLQLGLCLEVGEHLPSPQAVQRWLAEPTRLALLPTSLFLPNAAGFPALRPPHAALAAALMGAGAALCLTGPPSPALPAALQAALASVRSGAQPGCATTLAALAAHPRLAYTAYLRHLCASRPAPSPYEAELARWQHTLMAPLQPLAHHLTSGTYEVFERDVPKYACYQRAVEAALGCLRASASARAPAPSPPPLRVLVIGAGRGPLVARVLAAAAAVAPGQPLQVVALEKNPHAYRQLCARGQQLGWEACSVTLLHQDVRDFCSSSSSSGSGSALPFDLLVSELLGSFGDNELSPECLAAALPLLAPSTGLCIPAAYTSYLTPVTCATLWGSAQRSLRSSAAQDGAFVTRMPRALPLAPPCAVFTFRHSAPGVEKEREREREEEEPHSLARSASLHFSTASQGAALPALLHGFAGHFTAVLFPGIELSTLPGSATEGMHSWFPLFLPLRTPVAVGAGEGIALGVWRCVEGGTGAGGRVWYEWALRQPAGQGLQNAQGKCWDMRC